MLKSRGIDHYYSHSDRKCAVVERVNREIQRVLYKMMYAKGTLAWSKMLTDVDEILNNRWVINTIYLISKFSH